MAATVDADHTIAMLHEEQHLGVPVVGAERPAMMEDDRLALAPVLVEDFGAVLSGDRSHCGGSFVGVSGGRICGNVFCRGGSGEGHGGYHAKAAPQDFSARYRALCLLIQIGHCKALLLSQVFLTR